MSIRRRPAYQSDRKLLGYVAPAAVIVLCAVAAGVVFLAFTR